MAEEPLTVHQDDHPLQKPDNSPSHKNRRLDRAESVMRKSNSVMTGSISTGAHRQKIIDEQVSGVVLPWSKGYRAWWGFTVVAAFFTIFTETYQIAFAPAGQAPDNSGSSIIEYTLMSIFAVDIVVNFRLVYFDENADIVYDTKRIAKNYLKCMFWIDWIGVFPFYVVLLAMTGQLGQDSQLASYLSLVRLLRLVRLHRMKQLFDILQYNTRVSLMALTLTRNMMAAIVWSHFSACVIYFISRQYNFDPDKTWIGGSLEELSDTERYLTSLYWSVVTFTTVGYGDFSPVNSAEQIWGMIFMLTNIIFQSWVIGSMTLLIVKNDEKTGDYRDSIQVLHQYSVVNSFSKSMEKSLRKQLKLEFSNREIADEQVLSNFPTAVRRKVLRKLYLPSLLQTDLMKHVRQQLVDAFLTTCSVEIFGPGEELLQRGSIASDLYLLVGGVVKLIVSSAADKVAGAVHGSSLPDGEEGEDAGTQLEAGEFINEIGFFTESPQAETVVTKTICKTLTMSKSAYKLIAEDHPASITQILKNLLAKAQRVARDTGSDQGVNLPTTVDLLRAGSAFGGHMGDDSEDTSGKPMDKKPSRVSYASDVQDHIATVRKKKALTAVQDLIQGHLNKQKDDHTTRFLFAASRGDTSVIDLMCDQGFDPDSADYDKRTALMVASMKGNKDAVAKLLEYHASPNLVDMHGSSALYEAASNGHEDTMQLLLDSGAELCLDEGKSASLLCQTVFDGDILMLRRLLRAKIDVNAADYDKRTAAHIAATEGNLAAMKVLVEFGVDMSVRDRWNNSIEDEAKRADKRPLLEFIKQATAEVLIKQATAEVLDSRNPDDSVDASP